MIISTGDLEVSMASVPVEFNQKRRTTRVYREIPMKVQGTDAFLAPYQDQVSTVAVNCHGCRYQSKHEVLQGDVVLLEVMRPDEHDSSCSTRARVKWVQRRPNKDRPFEVAVELEAPGNIWGIASQPEDWLSIPEPRAIERANSASGLQAVTPAVRQTSPEPNGKGALVTQLERNDTAMSASPMFTQLMIGFGEQIQIMASDAVRAALVKEKSRLVEEFRFQLQVEAMKMLETVISTSKEELTRQILKELNDAYESAAQSNFERWINKFQREMEEATRLMAIHGQEVSQRFDNMALSTVERLQRNLEAAHRDGVDRVNSRLQERLAPLLEDARVTSEKLASSGKIFKQEAQTTYIQFKNSLRQESQKLSVETQQKIAVLEKQFEAGMDGKLAQANDELNAKLAAIVNDGAETMVKLSKAGENAMRQASQSLASSAADYATKILRERTAEISRQFLAGLEASTRNYLESLSKSITQLTTKTAVHSHD
jgi:hypothetical protein